MQTLRLVAGQRLFVARPGGFDAAVAADAVGDEADGKRIAVGVVVNLDGFEVGVGEECRAACARRQPQFGGIGIARQRRAAVLARAQLSPLRRSQAVFDVAVVEVGREAHFASPALAALPAAFAEVVGG